MATALSGSIARIVPSVDIGSGLDRHHDPGERRSDRLSLRAGEFSSSLESLSASHCQFLRSSTVARKSIVSASLGSAQSSSVGCGGAKFLPALAVSEAGGSGRSSGTQAHGNSRRSVRRQVAAPRRVSEVSTDESTADALVKGKNEVQECIDCGLDRHHLLRNPTLNKGTAFTPDERDMMRIRGLLPPKVEALEAQARRVMGQLNASADTLNRYIILSGLQTTNETLFYYLLINYLEELLPIVYTPTVGEACQKFGNIYRSAQGMYFCTEDKGHIRKMLDYWPHESVDVVVVTDGGRILGLGDLGANGMPIPIGKLSLYVAGGGFNPVGTLPVLLDAGTNNEVLLNDSLYLGSRHKRITGQPYLEFVDEFVNAVKDKWPKALIQFEDFNTESAITILKRHRYSCRSFNDDIQGTGAVIAAGLINASKAQKTSLRDAVILFYGAGSAAVGVSETIVALLKEEGLSTEEAKSRIYMVDRKGLITADRPGGMEEHKKVFARHDMPAMPEGTTLVDIIAKVKPTALLGLSGNPGVFTKEVVEEMCKCHPRPAIFPLSNPTSKAELTATNAIEWSKGQAIFAAGSPFGPVQYNGKTYVPGQGNNMFIFPGVGLGAVLAQVEMVTDGMFIAASRSLADSVSDEDISSGKVFPSVSRVREISADVASAIMKKAFDDNLAGIDRPADIKEFVKRSMYQPQYVSNFCRPRSISSV
ncbi:hypothetical protein CBR_g34906 [Chara braunii]|uniref:Malic enzyme n=1 Tax=Chara braunii TaxID=69332 RepID=A0A388LJM1_CHABU|nr:hypothetical protein CBR_g34906 [Chara braunii]|eukprot:GBG82530.1 hypothetical protein CBR_g34906 [Chara braunii]